MFTLTMNERFSLDGGYIGEPLFLFLIFAESYDVNVPNNPSLEDFYFFVLGKQVLLC